MDFNSLKDQVSNLTLYDIKAGVRKVQNAVMNFTEMEAKVREATNNEPWGASSTLMQEIANGTYNYQLLNEIMPMIYKRFTEKAAEEWRQIYKALQLLEFLIKNGSERVIDDARSHIGLLKMLRQFHYIDQNGKDQGINVRNRAKELAEMLSDVDRIRAERKKSKQTRNKYSGVEGGMGFGGGMSSGSGSRYGGFGSDEAGYGGYSGGVYGDGGGFGGSSQHGDFQDSGSSNRRQRFEEYDEYDEGAVAAAGRRQENMSGPPRAGKERSTKKTEPAKKQPEVDLFEFGDDEKPSSASKAPANGKQSATSGLNDDFGTLQSGGADDDDFDDFQSAAAPPSATTTATPAPFKPNYSSNTAPTPISAPQPVSGAQSAAMSGLTGFSTMTPAASSSTSTPSNASAFAPPIAPQQPLKPTGYQATQPNYFTSVPTPSAQPAKTSSSSTFSPAATATSSAGAKPASGDAFGSLWSAASVGVKKTSTPTAQGPNLASMAKEKASAGIWGAATTPAASQSSTTSQMSKPVGSAPSASGPKAGNGLDDLLL